MLPYRIKMSTTAMLAVSRTVRFAAARGENNSGHNKHRLSDRKQVLDERLLASSCSAIIIIV
jgi:hypothetical protein